MADFLEFAELMVIDARHRQESCGGHFNEAFHTEEGEATSGMMKISAMPLPGKIEGLVKILYSTKSRWNLNMSN